MEVKIAEGLYRSTDDGVLYYNCLDYWQSSWNLDDLLSEIKVSWLPSGMEIASFEELIVPKEMM